MRGKKFYQASDCFLSRRVLEEQNFLLERGHHLEIILSVPEELGTILSYYPLFQQDC